MSEPKIPEDQTPEDVERSARLFEWLAAQEPPLDEESDTAPSRTAPRQVVTKPVMSIGGGRSSSRYVILSAMAVALFATILLTLFVFNADSQEPTPEATEISSLPQIIEPTDSPTPTTRPATATPYVEPTMLPTAASDEIAVALLTPVATIPQGGAVLMRNQAFTITGSTGRTGLTTYMVQQGDTLISIGSRFGLDICSIVWANPSNRISPLRPGKTLDILPVDGALYTVERNLTIGELAEKTQVTPDVIINAPYNNLFTSTAETVLVEGMKIIVPGGVNGNCTVWSPPVGAAGSSGSSAAGASGGAGSLWGCAYNVSSPGYPATRPIQGRYNFTQSFSAVHSGVDLSAGVGTSVSAAGSGAVAFAGWNDGGYGNAIVIDHGGVYTLYAHLSEISVSCGQSVGAGERIGAVGSTGRSSGPHLHFEIRDAGFNALDPTGSMGF